MQTGANIDLWGFKLGGSVGHDEVGETKRDFFTAGIGFDFGPVGTSITYGQIFSTNSDFDEATGFGDSGLQPGALGRLSRLPRAWCWRAT